MQISEIKKEQGQKANPGSIYTYNDKLLSSFEYYNSQNYTFNDKELIKNTMKK